MPEGHVIHRLARLLNMEFAGQRVQVTSPQGVFAAQAAIVDGTEFEVAQAHGKHLFISFGVDNPEHIIYIHLGLIGSLGFQPADQELVGAVRMAISNEHTVAHLHGPQWCRLITDADMDAAIVKLGADPNRGGKAENAEKWASIKQKIERSRRSIASLLMDQKFFAGVGNIYRAEVLFRLGIHPDTPGRGITQLDDIWDDLVLLMQAGEKVGRIDTVRPAHMPNAMGRPPRKDDHGGEVYVYRRPGAPCYICGTPIQEKVVEGRNLFWCPGCQK